MGIAQDHKPIRVLYEVGTACEVPLVRTRTVARVAQVTSGCGPVNRPRPKLLEFEDVRARIEVSLVFVRSERKQSDSVRFSHTPYGGARRQHGRTSLFRR